VLVTVFDWRSTFLVNIPITVIALLLTLAWIPKDQPLQRRALPAIAARLDIGGILLFGGMMSALLVFLLSLPSPAWMPLGIGIALCGLLVTWELRAATPFIDLRLLASNVALTRTYVRGAFTLLSFYTVLYGVTQWLQVAHGLSPQAAGLVLLPMGIVAAIVSQPISARNLVRGPLIIGAASLLLASAVVALFTSTTPIAVIVGVTVLFAITLGTTMVGNQTALYLQAPADHVGTAAGLPRHQRAGALRCGRDRGICRQSAGSKAGIDGHHNMRHLTLNTILPHCGTSHMVRRFLCARLRRSQWSNSVPIWRATFASNASCCVQN
jgi:hypothetical protein